MSTKLSIPVSASDNSEEIEASMAASRSQRIGHS